MDLQAILKSHEPIGLAASILKDGEPFFQGTSGWAEREKTKVMLNTTFELASCSKQFTGYCIQLLQNQGLLSITDPISKYFPLLQPNVKIQNLLWHTSGIPDYFKFVNWNSSMTNDTIVKAAPNAVLLFEPGSKYQYSNTNYVILASLVEKLTGRPYPVFIWETIFYPLGMTSTRIFNAPDGARGYSEGSICEWPTFIYGDGSVWTTIVDFQKWARHLYYNFDMPMFQNGKFNNGDSVGYGYGIKIGHDYFGHNGGWAGYSTSLWYYLKEKVAVAILSNDENIDTESIADLLVAGIHPGAVKIAQTTPVTFGKPTGLNKKLYKLLVQ